MGFLGALGCLILAVKFNFQLLSGVKMINKETSTIGQVKIPLARVIRCSGGEKVLAGNLSSSQCVYLFPPKIKGKDWGLAVGARGETPRIMTNLREIADGVLESDGETKWHAKRVNLPANEKCTWDIYFSASKA